jgi:membrane protease YdiL (CAAX protease family)
MRFDRPSPAPPLSRASLVIGLYGAIALTGLMLSSGRGDPDVYRLPIADARPAWMLLVSPVLGLALGLAVVALTRVAVARYDWARTLHASFRETLGPLTGREVFVLAAASAIGEEILFRGALLPWWGLVPSVLAFGLLHIGPGKRFLPWTASALVMGLLFAVLAQTTGDLGGPIVAHFVINLLNLRFITAPSTARG